MKNNKYSLQQKKEGSRLEIKYVICKDCDIKEGCIEYISLGCDDTKCACERY